MNQTEQNKNVSGEFEQKKKRSFLHFFFQKKSTQKLSRWIQRIISAVHSAIRGGMIFGEYLVGVDVVTKHVPFLGGGSWDI